MTDYTKTYVRIKTQEEQTKAIDFYKSKGYTVNGISGFNPAEKDWYIRRRDVNRQTYFSDYNDLLPDSDIDITEDVLGVGKPFPKETYKDTYILTENNLERINLAIEFYKSKGFDVFSDSEYNIYTRCGSDGLIYRGPDYYLDEFCRNYRNITEEFNQWLPEEKRPSDNIITENTAVRITSEREFNLLMDAYEKKGWRFDFLWDNIKLGSNVICIYLDDIGNYDYEVSLRNGCKTISTEEAMKILGEDIPHKTTQINKEEPTVSAIETKPQEICNKVSIYDTPGFWNNRKKQYQLEQPMIDINPYGQSRLYDKFTQTFTESKQPLTSKQPTKMTQINTDLFERFIKGTKTQVLDSVERAEDSINERAELINTIGAFYRDYGNSKESLERAYNQQDKQSIKKYLKEVQSKEDILKDELFQKQLFPVIKSINKVLEKKSK